MYFSLNVLWDETSDHKLGKQPCSKLPWREMSFFTSTAYASGVFLEQARSLWPALDPTAYCRTALAMLQSGVGPAGSTGLLHLTTHSRRRPASLTADDTPHEKTQQIQDDPRELRAHRLLLLHAQTRTHITVHSRHGYDSESNHDSTQNLLFSCLSHESI